MDVQKQQFQNALHHEKAVLQELESKYNELQRMYENRPSRQEDLDKINELDSELEEREENYRKLWDEMNFYKLELHNREMNYNKMFGANPTVGTVDPTGGGSSPRGSGDQDGGGTHSPGGLGPTGRQRQLRYHSLLSQYGDVAEGSFLCHEGEEEDEEAAAAAAGGQQPQQQGPRSPTRKRLTKAELDML